MLSTRRVGGRGRAGGRPNINAEASRAARLAGLNNSIKQQKQQLKQQKQQQQQQHLPRINVANAQTLSINGKKVVLIQPLPTPPPRPQEETVTFNQVRQLQDQFRFSPKKTIEIKYILLPQDTMLFEVQSEVEVSTTTTPSVQSEVEVSTTTSEPVVNIPEVEASSTKHEVTSAVSTIMEPVAAKAIPKSSISEVMGGEISFDWDPQAVTLPLNSKVEEVVDTQMATLGATQMATLGGAAEGGSLASTLELAGQILSVNSAIIGQHLQTRT